MNIVREHINEKFVEDSDPIHDLGIGIIPVLEKIKLRIKEIIEDVTQEPLETQIYDNFEFAHKNNKIYHLSYSYSDEGTCDAIDIFFSYDMNANEVVYHFFYGEGYDLQKRQFTIKSKSLSNFFKKINDDSFLYKKMQRVKHMSKAQAMEYLIYPG